MNRQQLEAMDTKQMEAITEVVEAVARLCKNEGEELVAYKLLESCNGCLSIWDCY